MKYGHTPILPWSQNRNYDKDDVFLTDISCFEGKKVVYTEKMDGENSSCFTNKIHARSEDGFGKSWQHYMLKYHSVFANDIPEGMQICGESVYATHSIQYDTLPTCYFVFAIFVDGISLSWADVKMWSNLLGLDVVPEIAGYPDVLTEIDIPSKSAFGRECEGYVVRNVEAFPVSKMQENLGKSVRKHHVKTDVHWTKNWQKASFTEDPIDRLLRKRAT